MAREEEFIRVLESVFFYPNVQEEICTGRDLLDLLKNSCAHEGNIHHEETLFRHLIAAGVHSEKYAKEKGWWCRESSYPWLYFLVGFLHDIGKLGARRPTFGQVSKKVKRYSLKCHALLGAALLDSWLLQDDNFLKALELSEGEAALLATAVNYHMCV